MTLAEHLLELRARLLRAALVLVAGAIGAFFAFHAVFTFLEDPYCRLKIAHSGSGGHCGLYAFGVLDPFFIKIKVSIIIGAILTAPLWLYQLWAFITPGLHRHERRWASVFLAGSTFFFAVGALFGYLTLSEGLQFLVGFGGSEITPLLAVTSYLNFVTAMILIFGLSFEFPLVVVLLNAAGVVSADKLRKWRRVVIFGIFAFAAVGTPTQDPITMLAMALPLTVFYEGAVLVARLHDSRAARRAAEAGFAGLSDDEASPLEEVAPLAPAGADPAGSGY